VNYSWHHGDWTNHWRPWYGRPAAWWGAGFATGLVVATPWSWGYCSYINPYYTTPIVVGSTAIDYSQPIVLAQPPVQAPVGDIESQLIDPARRAFAAGDYARALRLADQAIAEQPADTVLHEFRSLILFATGQYKAAAESAYAVLSVGPGWDWTTLSGFYPDVNVYAQQLRSLEDYADAHPEAPDAHFLLAYHYLTCGHTDAAAAQLRELVRLNPQDRLATQLLASLNAPQETEAVAAAGMAEPAQPVNAAALVGNWKARQPDGTTIALTMSGDSKYTWQVTRQGKPQTFSGPYTLADNVLILKQGNSPTMVGQVALSADGRLNFKLANDNPADPGLTFSR
jgi:tetratricopeptide (TPR) repeat protein